MVAMTAWALASMAATTPGVQLRTISRGIRMCMQQLLEARLRSAHVVGTTGTMAGERAADLDYQVKCILMIV
jgi:hypothetical protein